jgi:hypothetical protein
MFNDSLLSYLAVSRHSMRSIIYIKLNDVAFFPLLNCGGAIQSICGGAASDGPIVHPPVGGMHEYGASVEWYREEKTEVL